MHAGKLDAEAGAAARPGDEAQLGGARHAALSPAAGVAGSGLPVEESQMRTSTHPEAKVLHAGSRTDRSTGAAAVPIHPAQAEAA